MNVAWVDLHKANDMAPHSWVLILRTLEFVGVATNVRKLLRKSMEKKQFRSLVRTN